MAGILDTINDAASSSGIDADYLARIAKIESGMNPKAQDRGSSYKGLFQLSVPEFRKYGGGDIFNPVDNARAAASMMAQQRNEFTAKYGRPPTPTEAYMIHQQGSGGLDAHLANPNAPAWQNMLSTGEGQQKGADWAKRAIWGNIPDYLKPQFGNVNNVTSDAFINQVWRPKVEGGNAEAVATGSPAGPVAQADALPAYAGSGSTGSPAGLPGLTAQNLGAQGTPAGAPLFSGLQGQPGQPGQPGQNPMAMAQIGQGIMGAGSIPFAPMRPMQFAPLPRPPINYSGLQAMLAGQRGFS